MTVTVNGERRAVSHGITVAAFLRTLAIDARGIAVERNRAIVPRSAYETMHLEEDDEMEVVRVIGGG